MKGCHSRSKKRFLVILSIVVLCVFICGAKSGAPEGRTEMHIGNAVTYCDSHSLSAVEGIWRFGEDDLIVLIRESGFERYEMIVVDSNSSSLVPGMIFGELMRSGEDNKFKMTVYGRGGVLKHNRVILATLNGNADMIGLHKGKIDFRVNLLGYLPYLSRMLRLRYDDPSRNLVPGLFKIYPSYDGNGSSRYKVRLL